MKKTHLIGYTLIILILFLTLLMISVFIIEIVNVKDKLLKSQDSKIISLHETNYYVEGGKLENPYAILNNKEVHPYYTFFLPTQKIQNKEVDKNIISFNRDYFRKNTFEDLKFDKKGVLLGGSTAFGYYASKDKFSPAALISKYSSINFKNLNAPSWNSHQELIALVKYNQNYDYVIALTGSNDISIYCGYNKNSQYIDTPENFKMLKEIVKNWSYFHSSQISASSLVKSFLAKTFPDTYYLLAMSLKKNKSKNKSKNRGILGTCDSNDVKKIANKFIQNHQMIKKIAILNNAKYTLILQPILDYGDGERYNFNSLVYNEIINSSFCKTDCYNFIDIFINSNLNKKFYSNDFKYKESIFVDTVHLTDSGNRILATEIVKILNN